MQDGARRIYKGMTAVRLLQPLFWRTSRTGASRSLNSRTYLLTASMESCGSSWARGTERLHLRTVLPLGLSRERPSLGWKPRTQKRQAYDEVERGCIEHLS